MLLGNRLVAIIKIKIITSYRACRCDSSIVIGVGGGAISQEVVALACMQELQIDLEFKSGVQSSRLNWCQEPQFNYCIQYSFQI